MSEVEVLEVKENRVEIRVRHVVFIFFKNEGKIKHNTMNFGRASSRLPKGLYSRAFRQAAAILNKKKN